MGLSPSGDRAAQHDAVRPFPPRQMVGVLLSHAPGKIAANRPRARPLSTPSAILDARPFGDGVDDGSDRLRRRGGSTSITNQAVRTGCISETGDEFYLLNPVG